ncbi:tectonic-1-like [Maniola jurtina]|uniref:tectonic-1-like n=1 Tax=Maniola jurtina TaxID=191418 RepID=UPI001E68BE14|nr:tectonic-1-like [Maniola jurtina]
MKPITYLCFTLLSLAIQFCLMDFINGKVGIDTAIDSNSTIAKNLSNMFRNIKQTPHALYYRTEKAKFQIINKSTIKYNNGSITEAPLSSTTELASTVFDLLYDESVSVTDDESESATETFSTTELDNVTEISFFDKKSSPDKPSEIPKKISTNECYCNLLYKICDINCCCDNDCSDLEKSLSKDCEEIGKEKCELRNKEFLSMCSSQFVCNKELQSDIFGYLFCIGKVNLPEKRKTNENNMLHTLDIDNRLQWHITKKKRKNIKFSKAVYIIGQPLWLLTNNSVEALEVPITVTNDYCNGEKAVKYLTNEYIKCYVRLKDLHMLDIIKRSERTKIASAKESTINSPKMNCTTLHCTNWTLLVCDEHKCTEYIHELHEPSCTDSYCNNIGVKIEYEFYCNVSLIIKAIVKFHIRTISMALEFVTQEVTVNFFMGNNSIDKIVKFSGNPGYIRGLPIIVSLFESNHTENFYNNSLGRSNLVLPYNKGGGCVVTNLTHNILKFGHNKRISCRAHFAHNLTIHNGTDGCLNIQAKIDELYGLSPNIFISPYGNPQDISDEKWISLQKFDKSNIYGEYHSKDSKLLCYNLITRIAFIIAFADMGDVKKEENKILSAKVDCDTKNITFSIEDLSTVLTIDTIYIDARKPNVHEYIGAPHLNFHLPKDLFYPLASSKSTGSFMKYQMIILCISSFI